jgi:glutamate N-acetyltransferase/amino-acid N-acetyltransferase
MRSNIFNEASAHAVMKEREYTITLDFGLGKAECRFLTCDFTEEYVRINADYST